MPSKSSTEPQVEIGHVLFIDIVGYSKRLVNDQTALVARLNRIVRGTEQFRNADAADKLITIPTGDGMALVFFTAPDTPVRCAIEIGKADIEDPKIELRMGIHSGPVDRVADVNLRSNVTGAGINMAQRVMDCGDSGHILLSKRSADDLAQYDEWKQQLHDLGEVEVKHGVQLGIVSLYTDEIGNPTAPEKLIRAEQARQAATKATVRRKRRRLVIGMAALSIAAALGSAGTWAWHRRIALASAYKAGSGQLMEKSIAVLPFENFEADKESSYFADGVQDDILTDLAKVADLKVISRRSMAQYRGSTQSIRDIGQALQVAYILEGTVRRIGSKIRLTAQLIDTRTQVEKWAEKYERDLADLFAIQNQISESIVGQLKATISPAEKTAIETAPTHDMEAYDMYLQARAIVYAV
ncbi:MAG: adenylate/guanylate cyclase domain-containing protein, partial [Chthoniobacterales bacterium]